MELFNLHDIISAKEKNTVKTQTQLWINVTYLAIKAREKGTIVSTDVIQVLR